ncbi:hypothetical protein DL95DRAFT_3259 [Leptodontidium sp. 2 PMI_412]|nr:hypothetical protein DL95DRAFT_3259 [Leptodontidium sp. 2 PMI_412]
MLGDAWIRLCASITVEYIMAIRLMIYSGGLHGFFLLSTFLCILARCRPPQMHDWTCIQILAQHHHIRRR